MKILLVNEASGYHRYLALGLRALGHEVTHVVTSDSAPQGRQADLFTSTAGTSIVAKVKRNLQPLTRLGHYRSFEIINFILSLSTLPGRVTRYLDLPFLAGSSARLSYIGTGCDPIALLRVRSDASSLPCGSCMRHDEMGRSCETAILSERTRALRFSEFIRYTITPCYEYDHAHASFPNAIHRRIPLPICTSSIPFLPARTSRPPRIFHAPSRRGFKGTPVILEAIEILRREGVPFEFKVVEGLPFAEYMACISEADVHIDQVLSKSAGMAALESLCMGKIVVSGNSSEARAYFPFSDESPVIQGSSDPQQLAGVLRDVLNRRDDFESMAHHGRSFVEAHHDHVKVAAQFVDLWKTV